MLPEPPLLKKKEAEESTLKEYLGPKQRYQNYLPLPFHWSYSPRKTPQNAKKTQVVVNFTCQFDWPWGAQIKHCFW